MKLGQSVVPYELNSQKRVTHSTIKVLHQPTSSECVTTFPCSLPRAYPNDIEGKLQKFAMIMVGVIYMVCRCFFFFLPTNFFMISCATILCFFSMRQ